MRGRDTNTSLSHTRQSANIQVEQCTHFLMNSVGLILVSGCCFFLPLPCYTFIQNSRILGKSSTNASSLYEIPLTFFVFVFHSLC